MLEVRNVNAFYGKIQALWDICLDVNASEIVALVGSNGAGKTTLVNTITGLHHPSSGSISFLGKQIESLPSHSIVELGVSYVPQGGKVFPEMTVTENLEMGAYPIHAWKQKEETFEQGLYEGGIGTFHVVPLFYKGKYLGLVYYIIIEPS